MTVPKLKPIEDDRKFEYFAIEALGPESPRKRLVGVVADLTPDLALQSLRDHAQRCFPHHTLSARIVSCPGIADPLPIHGWMHFTGPDEKARCPACRRALAEVPKGYRWSVRLADDPRAKGKERGHGTHTCVRSDCKRGLEIVISQVPGR